MRHFALSLSFNEQLRHTFGSVPTEESTPNHRLLYLESLAARHQFQLAYNFVWIAAIISVCVEVTAALAYSNTLARQAEPIFSFQTPHG